MKLIGILDVALDERGDGSSGRWGWLSQSCLELTFLLHFLYVPKGYMWDRPDG